MIDMPKAVAYARYSSDMQREESIDAQLSAIQKYADQYNMVLIGEYIDRAKSGTSDKRPEFLNMIADAKAHMFDVIIVHKLDRFSRDKFDSVFYKRELRMNGIKLVSVTERLDDSPESVLMESVIEGMGQFYSANLAREVMKGLRENAKQGKSTGGPPPFGYRVDPETKLLVLDEHEAQGVQFIFERILEGYSYHSIIQELNSMGYVTRGNKPFGSNSLHNLLKNEKYRGCFIFNKSLPKDVTGKRNGHKYKTDEEILRIENGCPRIVSDEAFYTVQQKMKVRQQQTNHRNIKEDYLLRGKIICEKCGGTYVGSRRKRGDGTYWTYYDCNRKMRENLPCTHSRELSKTYIEGFVLNKLAEFVFDDKLIPTLTEEYNVYLKAHNGGMPDMTQLRSQHRKVVRKIDNLIDTLSEAKSSSLVDKLNSLENERSQLEQRIRELERVKPKGSVTQKEMREVFQIIRKKLASRELEAKKQLIEIFVNRITIYEDTVVIQFNLFPQISLPIASAKELQKVAIKEKAFGFSKALSFIASIEAVPIPGVSSVVARLTTAIQRTSKTK